MKIAFVHQPINIISSTDRRGSVEIVTYEMTRRLAKYCDVIVYAKKGRCQKEFEYNQGVQYRRISTAFDEWHNYLSIAVDKLERLLGVNALSRSIRRTFFFRNVKRPLFASRWYYWTYAWQVARQLRKEECDIVHIHTFSQFVPIIRAFNPNIKIVLHMHCEWLTQLDQEMIESRLREADLICGVSEYITEKIRCRFPQFAERCQTVFNGVDSNHFLNKNDRGKRKKNDIKQLLFVGRVSPEKGVHVLLDALKKVIGQYPQVQLKLVGDLGPLPIQFHILLSDDPKDSELAQFYRRNYIQCLKDQLSPSVASRVSFTGSIADRQLFNYYRDADVFVFPSVWNEPFGMPIIEAMSKGVPVVATKGGGIPEIVIDGKTGLLVERDDASALADAILRLLQDEKLRKSIAKAARERAVEFFSWDQTVKKLLHLYKVICSAED
jgi:glycosyltransferase involved in cell wall biosynthesis